MTVPIIFYISYHALFFKRGLVFDFFSRILSKSVKSHRVSRRLDFGILLMNASILRLFYSADFFSGRASDVLVAVCAVVSVAGASFAAIGTEAELRANREKK